jgi:hypothetical protein
MPANQRLEGLLVVVSQEAVQQIAVAGLTVHHVREAAREPHRVVLCHRRSPPGFAWAKKSVGFRCRNGPSGASHNETRPLFSAYSAACHQDNARTQAFGAQKLGQSSCKVVSDKARRTAFIAEGKKGTF